MAEMGLSRDEYFALLHLRKIANSDGEIPRADRRFGGFNWLPDRARMILIALEDKGFIKIAKMDDLDGWIVCLAGTALNAVSASA